MTENKPIIIDGVDVAGCVNHNDFKLASYDCYLNGGCQCKDNPNCYFKQLTRKTQECEKLCEANDEKNEFLKKLGISATGEFHRIKYYIDKLYQEYEELTADIVCRRDRVGKLERAILRRNEQLDQLKAKNERLKHDNDYQIGALERTIDNLKIEKEKMSKGYAELADIVSPYIDDFTGYNEKLGGFDIVLCVKELLQQLDTPEVENEELKKYIKHLHNLCGNETDKQYKYKQTLTEIKKIAEYEFKELMNAEDYHNMTEVLKQILQIIDEVE